MAEEFHCCEAATSDPLTPAPAAKSSIPEAGDRSSLPSTDERGVLKVECIFCGRKSRRSGETHMKPCRSASLWMVANPFLNQPKRMTTNTSCQPSWMEVISLLKRQNTTIRVDEPTWKVLWIIHPKLIKHLSWDSTVKHTRWSSHLSTYKYYRWDVGNAGHITPRVIFSWICGQKWFTRWHWMLHNLFANIKDQGTIQVEDVHFISEPESQKFHSQLLHVSPGRGRDPPCW